MVVCNPRERRADDPPPPSFPPAASCHAACAGPVPAAASLRRLLPPQLGGLARLVNGIHQGLRRRQRRPPHDDPLLRQADVDLLDTYVAGRLGGAWGVCTCVRTRAHVRACVRVRVEGDITGVAFYRDWCSAELVAVSTRRGQYLLEVQYVHWNFGMFTIGVLVPRLCSMLIGRE